MRASSWFGLVFVGGLLAGLAPATGLAQEPLSEADRQVAQQHFERGSLSFERGDYAEAAVEFQAAYVLTQHADLLYNIYSAQERNGELEAAADALQNYLRDSDPEGDRREALELRLERLRLRIDQANLEATEANLEADRERRRAAADLEAEQEERAAAEARADQERGDRLARESAAHETADTLVLAGVGVILAGGLGGLSFGVFAGLSEAEDQSLAGSCGRDVGRFCSDDDVGALQTFNTAADASWIVGLGLAAVGATIVLIGEGLRPSNDSEESTATSVVLRPTVSPVGAGAMVGGRW